MKRSFSCALALLFLLTAGCGAPTVGDVGAVQQFFAMNTVMSITVQGDNGEAAAQSARAEIDRLEKLLSRTLTGSQSSDLNRHAGDGMDVVLSPDLAGLLQRSKDMSVLVGGALDVTVAPIMDAWGFTTDQYRVPTQSELDGLLPLVDSANLLVDETASTARLLKAGMAVDLGAVAKGFAADRATDMIRAAGADSALLDLGGNITALGYKPNGDPWRVAIKDPQNTDAYLCILPLTDQTASTSGGYERYFEENGIRYHHIVDPKTGYPAGSGLLSVSVISADATLADGLSTSLFVLGADRALELWRAADNFELVLCKTDGTVVVTEGLEPGLAWRGEKNGYTYEIARR